MGAFYMLTWGSVSGRRARPGDARPRTVLRGLSVCVLFAGRVGTGDCVVASVMLVLWVLMIEQY